MDEESCLQASMLTWEKIAASAYRAYCNSAYSNSAGNKNFQGNPIRAWEDLPQSIQTAWEAAVRHADICLRMPAVAMESETRWAGWIPPHLKAD